MQYVVFGKIIKTENTAKPYTQKSKHVVDYLLSKAPVKNLLDFGCGKLRYSDVLTQICNKITFVDSELQLYRKQMVRGVYTSVNEYILKNYPSSQCISYEKLDNHEVIYDLIICTNVLSAVPCEKSLKKLLFYIKKSLSNDGVAIFINQYKSSYFSRFSIGIKHLYGYLYESRNGYSYYGILDKEIIEKILIDAGFFIKKSWCEGESTYIEVQTNHS